MKFIRMLMFVFVFFGVELVMALAFAQSPTPIPNVIDHVAGVIPSSLPVWLMGLVGVFMSEVVMRAWPTAQPKSWLLLVSRFCKSLESFFKKISDLLDQVLQNVPEDKK